MNTRNDNSMIVKLEGPLPAYPAFKEGIRRAPNRGYDLNVKDTKIALKNALRYIPEEHHETMAREFYEELRTHGRIYGYRYRPEGRLYGKPIEEYKGNCVEGKAIQVMLDNNLDFDVALYPYELVTYGETGQVCQNWMQYLLIKRYLEVLKKDETLVIESGHPLGIFRSHELAPRVIITNAMMVGMFDNQESWHHAMQMGVANYGQMTAGGLMYRASGHRPWHLQYHSQCRKNEAGTDGRRESFGISLRLLRPRRNERSSAQGGRHCWSCVHRGGSG